MFAIWAAAAVPMGVAAWVVAPALAGPGGNLVQPLLFSMTAGLAWQFLLVAGLVAYEQRSLRWRVVRPALWLTAPQTSRRRGGWLWLWALAVTAWFGVVQFTGVDPKPPANRDVGAFLGSATGAQFLHGNWGEFAIIVVLSLLNTVLGEELLFRGLLLPRMRRAFGRSDWVANGTLFTLYHVHQPWSMPLSILIGLPMAFATKRLRSAWMGIIAHSAASVMIVGLSLKLVLS